MFGPPNQVFASVDAVCVSLICWNMLRNFATKNSSGVAWILFSSFKILARLGAASVNSTAGIGNTVFAFNGDG